MLVALLATYGRLALELRRVGVVLARLCAKMVARHYVVAVVYARMLDASGSELPPRAPAAPELQLTGQFVGVFVYRHLTPSAPVSPAPVSAVSLAADY
jgi:hypothetical protein